MLRTAWNKAVYQYQALRQTLDQDGIDILDSKLKDAREGKQTIYNYGSPMSGLASVHVIKLEPEAQQKVIAQYEKQRAAIVDTMEKRREKYGLKP